MRCMYGSWHDWTNKLFIMRHELVGYLFFYDQLIDDRSIIETLSTIVEIGKSLRKKDKIPEMGENVFSFIHPGDILSYFVSELSYRCRNNQRDKLIMFLFEIDDMARYFSETQYMPINMTFDELSYDEQTKIRLKFQKFLYRWVEFTESIEKKNEFIESLEQPEVLIEEKLLISSSDVRIDSELDEQSRNAVKTWEKSKDENKSVDYMPVIAMARAYAMGAHYAYNGDMLLSNDYFFTTSKVDCPSTDGITFKELIQIRKSDEWKFMNELFDAQHSSPNNQKISLNFNRSLEKLMEMIDQRATSSLIGSGISLASTVISPISIIQAVKGFVDYLEAKKTIVVTKEKK